MVPLNEALLSRIGLIKICSAKNPLAILLQMNTDLAEHKQVLCFLTSGHYNKVLCVSTNRGMFTTLVAFLPRAFEDG